MGPQVHCDGTTTFRLWAPSFSSLSIEFIEADGTTTQHPLMPTGGHCYESTFQRAPGTRYRYVMPDGLRVPDPASRFQARDVHGRVKSSTPTGYRWRNSACRRNWGYDGALLYAPDSTYGRPEDLKALIDAAHDRGLMVFLDVVYNHFGPDGNYLSVYARDFFSDRHKTPWGAAINFDGAHAKPLREFFIENAPYWIHEYRLDGLRFDAVHSLVDDSKLHLLDELAQRIRASAEGVHLIIENENNEAHRQNHDQIGNRVFGERLSALAQESARKALATVYLLAPQIPMLFMGEEWDAGQPFPCFLRFSR